MSWSVFAAWGPGWNSYNDENDDGDDGGDDIDDDDDSGDDVFDEDDSGGGDADEELISIERPGPDPILGVLHGLFNSQNNSHYSHFTDEETVRRLRHR